MSNPEYDFWSDADLVDRLQEYYKFCALHSDSVGRLSDIVLEAATMIKQLRARLEAEQTVNRVAQNHNHFSCATASALKDIEIMRLREQLE